MLKKMEENDLPERLSRNEELSYSARPGNFGAVFARKCLLKEEIPYDSIRVRLENEANECFWKAMSELARDRRMFQPNAVQKY